MLDFVRRHIAFGMAAVALALSGCNTFLDLRRPPDIYADAESVAEKTLVTIKAFGAAQETLIKVCGPALPESVEAEVCRKLIPVEQTLRPGVSAVTLIAAEYSDIDARIRELGPKAPAEWLVAAAEIAGQLAAAYDPIKADVDAFIKKAGELTNG